MSLYSFHGRGTLNGTIPHPALVRLFETAARTREAAAAAQRPYRRAHRVLLRAARRRRGRLRSISAFPARYTHSSLEVCDLADLDRPDAACWSPASPAIDGGFSLDRDDYRMRHYLGIDIGTFESKGVLVDGRGRIVATAAKPHKMLVPQPGWAEHRPREDWWGDFTFISREAACR